MKKMTRAVIGLFIAYIIAEEPRIIEDILFLIAKSGENASGTRVSDETVTRVVKK